MKILYVQPGQGVGGSKESLFQIVRSLPGKYDRQVVLDRPSDADYNVRIQKYVSACHLQPLPTWQKYHRSTFAEHARAPFADTWRLLKCVAAAIKIAQIIKHERIELVHTNNSMTPSGALAAWLTGVPHIWHVREPIGKNRQYPLLLGDFSLHLMSWLSREILCNSSYTAEVFTAIGIPVRVLLNGLDLASIGFSEYPASDMRLKYKISKEVTLVGMVGNLTTHWKRHDIFLDIAALVVKSAPRTRFIIFGSSTDLQQTDYTRSLQRKVLELGLTDRVIWGEFENNISAMMNSLDIMIHPAVTEGSGRVVMEAMASGKPVIAFRSGGVQELIEDGINGFLVDPQEPARAAELTLRLLEDASTRDIIGAAARKHAFKNFGVATMIDQLSKVYDEALK